METAKVKAKNMNPLVEGISNIFIFLPYFFSVNILGKTLFSPWKNLTSKKTQKAFSMSDVLSRMMFDLISRFIGFGMRFSIILFFFITLILYMLTIPFITILWFALYPVRKMFEGAILTEEDKKKKLKEDFITKHAQTEESKENVSSWFEYIYINNYQSKPWYKLESLMSAPPLARDWAVGYTPTLDDYSHELTTPEYQMSIRTHVVGREKDTQMIERVLSQSEEANALLVGEEGVGKRTIIEVLSKNMYAGKISPILAYKRLISLNMEKILTVSEDPLRQAELMELLLDEATRAGNIVLLMDTFDRYVSSGEGRVDLSSSIGKYARTDHLQIVGITTPFLYEKYVFQNEKIRTIFTKIDIEEVSKQTAFTILLDQAIKYEKKQDVIVPYETVLAILEKSSYYITTIPFPEKALQLLDAACVFAKQTAKKKVVTPDIINTVITSKTHAPTALSAEIKEKLLHLETLLSKKIIGQAVALNTVSSTLRRAFLLLGKRKKPLATFLFLGPTGVGKTETAKVISEVFFGDSSKMIRFDMSQYQSKEDVPKLIGSIETLTPGVFTNAIRENPYGVLLIDEIEKAHKDLLNLFLTVLDEGYFTDGFGQRVDCKNLIIVATSNAGSENIHEMLIKQQLSGGKNDLADTNSLINYLIEKRFFSPEFLNRFDGVIAYQPLDEKIALEIAKVIVSTVHDELLSNHQVSVSVSVATIEKLISEGYNSAFGVRNLERIIRQYVEDNVAKKILAGEAQPNQSVTL